MGLLDRVSFKKSEPDPPEEISVTEGNEIRILWPGGPEVTIAPHRLRDLCPCAACIEEGTGLPYASMRRVIKHFGLPLQPQVRRFIGSRSTLERREVAGRLSRVESERLARLAGLSGLAEFVWGSPALAQEFLATPHPQLESRTPLEAAESEIGARQVERLLWSIEHGLPA